MSSLVVEVKEGRLQGKKNLTAANVVFYEFKGIPYARPPVNELRFAIPQPPESWTGIRDATKDCNFCAQTNQFSPSQVVGDEDCLYLNVYTPLLPNKSTPLLPVMFNIHGGGFIMGNGTDGTDGPDYLIEKDVVVVSINYRLGALGFLSLDRKEAPGNVGLRDQVEALKWVQRNIVNFIGDPNNVTIFGESAGSASVEYLMLSPLARGLFHKAIAQSGSTLSPWAHNETVKELAFEIPLINGKTITDEQELYNYLMQLSTDELIKSSSAVIEMKAKIWKGGLYCGFVPTVEKPGDWEPFLSESPVVLLKRGDFTKVPLIGGLCSCEGLVMILVKTNPITKLKQEKNFMHYFPFNTDKANENELQNRLQSVYLDKNMDLNSDEFAINYFSDVDFNGAIYYALTAFAKKTSPVYFYKFSYDGGMNMLKKRMAITDRPGACHADDNGYIYMKAELLNEASKTDLLVRDRMTIMWTNFAKYGNPTVTVDKVISTKWEPFSKDSPVYLDIDADLTLHRNIMWPDRMKVYEEIFDNSR